MISTVVRNDELDVVDGLSFFIRVNEIESEWWDDMMIGESEWIKEYFMLDFNFGSNYKFVGRDTIRKMGSGVTIG